MGLNLNLGCGRNVLAGWINVDLAPMPGVNVVADLDACRTTALPFADGSAAQLRLIHVLEHIGDTLALMQELHRIAEPGAALLVHSPYGSSDDAYEDPTHRHRFFMNSFSFFGQPAFWRADYGYRGDWAVEEIALLMPEADNHSLTSDELFRKVRRERNAVVEMRALLRAIKPARPPDRAMQREPPVTVKLV